jgi:type II secretory pathway pseudopilin PulG
MVEIAICLAIIGIALVGILGTLPIGLREQRVNREQTVINQDATVFMEAIRNGARGSDDLTNYVFAITNNQTFYNPGPQTPVLIGFGGGYLTNGANIIGLLSTPEYTDTNGLALPNLSGGGYSNHVVAYVRSMSGPAVEKPPQDNSLLAQDSFTYRVVCGNLPVPMDPYAVTNSAYGAALTAALHELRLVFLWPQQPNGQLPPQPWSQTCRTLVAGQLVKYATPGVNLYFFQPQFFTNAP